MSVKKKYKKMCLVIDRRIRPVKVRYWIPTPDGMVLSEETEVVKQWRLGS